MTIQSSHHTSPQALVSWSGGKDSCLALWRARQSGMAIRRLITAMDESGGSSRSHGVPPALISAQAAALGAEMRFYDTSWKTYEEKFIAILRAARDDGITHAIFGDIDLMPHREWEEKVCGEAGITPCLPLWDEPRRKLVDEFLSLGFKAIVVCVNGTYLGEEFCGREFDEQFLADLPPNVDACGENGEFHTFVYDGPAFAQPVAFRRSEKQRYEAPAKFGGATYWFQRLVTT
ncbi:diphthine--ammonia ligase [Noviherbaspirillum cavernae]|uniref:Diphthine--ammonia ligase n=1 Tax=Noviherbaspirillum cavernae TaxID=2320862 RepID=A0A418X4S2_9BURK|nr:diphthine--ammonia ligase [Noviherbaspirillum cavernae]RJG07430.1 diphthine--ammonia ligase [Noviherbaspirillum cavernae]